MIESAQGPVPATAASSSRFLWWTLVVLAGLVLGALARAPEYLRLLGVNHLGVWFIDLHAVLASCDAVAAGFDPYAFNPLDHFGRVHCYPHWWLLLGWLGFTRADTQLLGFSLVAVFFVTAVAALRPRMLGEVFWMLAVLCSPPVLLALERANIDLVIFILLAPVVPCLLSPRPWGQLMAVPLMVGATMLKIYPLVAATVVLGLGSGREMRRLIGVGVLLLAVALPDMVGDFQRYARHLPEPDGLMTMGARNLLVSFGLPAGVSRWLGALGGAAVIVYFWRTKPLAGWTIPHTERHRWLGGMLGVALLTGCFFAGTSYAYRWVFALWLVPLLWQMARDGAAPARVRRWAKITAALLAFALWGDAAASLVIGTCFAGAPPEKIMLWADRFFHAEQPVIWALFVCLLGLLTHFAEAGMRHLFNATPAAAPRVQ